MSLVESLKQFPHSNGLNWVETCMVFYAQYYIVRSKLIILLCFLNVIFYFTLHKIEIASFYLI